MAAPAETPETETRPLAEEETVEPGERADALAAKDQELEECQQRLLRLQADFDNFRRRSRLEKDELSQVIAHGIFKELLPVLDNFERALAASIQDAGQLRTGVELVYRQLTGILEKSGVQPIVAAGAQFDPALHEAVMRVEDPGQADGLIVEELQKGYAAGGKVLRPSMVKVVGNA